VHAGLVHVHAITVARISAHARVRDVTGCWCARLSGIRRWRSAVVRCSG
jgi:hypothetical protein